MPTPMNNEQPILFIGQCLTETRTIQVKNLIQQVLDVIKKSLETIKQQKNIDINTGPGDQTFTAKYAGNFKSLFSEETQTRFSPDVFAQWRDQELKRAIGYVFIRTSMSESRNFEIGKFSELYADWEQRTIMLIANMPQAELKTTLTQNTKKIYFDITPLIDPTTNQTSLHLTHPEQLEKTLTETLLASPIIQSLMQPRTWQSHNQNRFLNEKNKNGSGEEKVFYASHLVSHL